MKSKNNLNSAENHVTKNLEIVETECGEYYKEKSKIMASMLEGKILEVGCGTGALLECLPLQEFEFVGADYSEERLEKAKKKKLNAKFIKADLVDKNSWNNLQGSFDTVIASEVIEHIENDSEALGTIAYLLKSGGILILTVPAFKFLYSNFDEKTGHLRRYSKKNICDLIQKAGFKIEKSYYWNLFGFLGWLIFFKILKKEPKEVAMNSMNSIMGKMLALESLVHMPLGLSVFVKARKI